jgi:GT2 family glycosyltransferase
MKKVSIITPTYNGLNVLKTCVQSIQTHLSSIDWEWIIGENSSSDGSLEWLQSLKDSRIKIIERTNEGNFSSMNNYLAGQASGKYLLFLNNDTEATDDFLTPMLNLIENDDSVGIVGANLFYPNGELQHGGVLIDKNLSPVNISDPLYRNIKTLNKQTHLKTREYQSVTGACLLIRAKDFEDVWGFDANYNWAYEDVDLCLKIKYHKMKKIVGCSHSNLRHYESYSKANPNLPKNFEFFKTRWKHVIKSDVSDFSHDINSYAKNSKIYEMTFVVCTHDIALLNECLISSLLKQVNQNFDLKVIYNFDNRYSSVKALNKGIRDSKTDFVICTHHDVIYNKKWTQDFLREISKYQGFGVAGLAGVKWLRTPIHKGVPVEPKEKIWVHCYGEITYPYEGKDHKYGQFSEGIVDVVDELCIIIRKSNEIYFDEYTLSDFHFYGPDISLISKNKGMFNAVINCPAYHKSDGTSSTKNGLDRYWQEFKKVHDKWKNIFPTVVTTTGYWHKGSTHTFIKIKETKNKNTTPVQSINLEADTTQRFEIKNYRKDYPIVWFLNDEKISHSGHFYIFSSKNKGIYRLSCNFVDNNGNNSYQEWLIQVTEKEDNQVILGMQQNFHTHNFGEIFGNKKISQEVFIDSPNLCRIDLFLGTFSRKNYCNLFLSITNSLSGDLLRFSSVGCDNIQDNDWFSFYFNPIDVQGKKIFINIECKNGSFGNSITAYFVNHTFNFGSLYFNNKKINGCLSFRLFFKK